MKNLIRTIKRKIKRRHIKFYLIYYLIIMLLTRGTIISTPIAYGVQFVKILFSQSSLESKILGLLFIIMTLVLLIGFYIFISWPVTISIILWKREDKQNQKYNSRKEILYYRDKLYNISPTTISLMKNLIIEEEKDLTATILKLQLNKNILIENNEIRVLSNDTNSLTESEKSLFNIISQDGLNRKNINLWKENSLQEAKSQGYIQNTDKEYLKRQLLIKKITSFIVFMLMILVVRFAIYNYNIMDKMEAVGQELVNAELQDSNISFAEFFTNNNYSHLMVPFVTTSSMGIIVILCLLGLIIWPIFHPIYISINKVKINQGVLKRTYEGEQLTDVILALKRFIHDFSNLSEAEKKDIVLWDDFIIYAVVLEENNNIINEIFELKNLGNIDSFSATIEKNKL